MTITALPDAPSRSDTPADFITKADAFVAALAVLVTEMNLAIASANQTKWISGTTYAIGDEVWSPADFQAYRRKTTGAGTTDPSADSTNWQRTEVSETSLQNQTYTAYTTGGTSTAYTLTPTPAVATLAENQEFDVEFHTAAGATPTLAISGLTAKNLKYRDTAGAKQAVTAAQVPTGWRSRVVYDGTDYIVREVATGGIGSGTALQMLRMNAAATGTEWAHPITTGAQVATTSGTTVNSDAIPATAKRVTVTFDQVTTDAAGTTVILQLSASSTFKTSGYIGSAGTTSFTAGFGVGDNGAAADTRSGAITLELMDPATNKWVAHGNIGGGAAGATTGISIGGVVSLAGPLDMVRVTTIAGTAAFDGGAFNISYE